MYLQTILNTPMKTALWTRNLRQTSIRNIPIIIKLNWTRNFFGDRLNSFHVNVAVLIHWFATLTIICVGSAAATLHVAPAANRSRIWHSFASIAKNALYHRNFCAKGLVYEFFSVSINLTRSILAYFNKWY